MKRTMKKLIATILSLSIVLSTIGFGGYNVAAATGASVTSVSVSTSKPQTDILHMDRKVTETGTDEFDVELTAYLDDTTKTAAPLDVVFVLDCSTSMGNNKDIAADATAAVINRLKEDGNSHRVGIVCFGTGVLASTNSLVSINSSVITNTLNSYRNIVGASTYTGDGMEAARDMLSAAKEEGRQQVCILMTDGVPGIVMFNSVIANNALKAASDMKNNGVIIYSMRMFFKLGENSMDEAVRFAEYISSYYGSNAVDINKSYTPTGKLEQRKVYVTEGDDYTNLVTNITKMMVASKLYPFVLNGSGFTKEVVTPYFTVSNASVEVQTPIFGNNQLVSGWSKSSESLTLTQSGNTLMVTGFDYTDRCVSVLNSAKAARLVIKYHIKPIENFFGGNDIPTNIPGTDSNNNYSTGGSGIYCNGYFLKQFNDIPVCININQNAISVESSDDFFFGETINPNDYIYAEDLANGRINGLNNQFVSIVFAAQIYKDGTSLYQTQKMPFAKGEAAVPTSFSSLTIYDITSSIGDEIMFTYFVAPSVSAENAKSNLGTRQTSVSITETGILKVPVVYKAVFVYDDSSDNYEQTKNIAKPANTQAVYHSEESIETYVDAINNGGTSDYAAGAEVQGSDGKTYIFAGWKYSDTVVDENTGVGTMTYIGRWISSPEFEVKIHFMTTAGEYEEVSSKSYPAEIGDTVSMSTYTEGYLLPTWYGYYNENDKNYFNTCWDNYNPLEFEWLYYHDENGEKQKINRDNYANVAVGPNEFTGYQLVHTHSDGSETDYIRGEAGTYSGYWSNNKPNTIVNLYETGLALTRKCYFCSGCGSVVTTEEYALDSDGIIWWDCPTCGTEKSTVEFTDFEINEALSNTDLTVTSNVTDNVINIYVDRCKHTVTYTCEDIYDDKTESITRDIFYGFENYTDVYSDYTETGYIEEIEAVAFCEEYGYGNYTPIESTPFCDFEIVESTAGFSTTYGSFIPENGLNEWAYGPNDYWGGDGTRGSADWITLCALDLTLFSCYQGFDVVIEAQLIPRVFDVEITKMWKNTATRFKQNCIFALYEKDDNGVVSFVTRFTIAHGETTKTIKGLTAGKTYILQEESWSYKSQPANWMYYDIVIEYENRSKPESEKKDPWVKDKYINFSEMEFVCECLSPEDISYYTETQFLDDNIYVGSGEDAVLQVKCENKKTYFEEDLSVDKAYRNDLDVLSGVVVGSPIRKYQ